MEKRKRQKRVKANKKNVDGFPAESHKALNDILDLTNSFCDAHLNEDYKQLCEDAVIELLVSGVPIDKGRPASWASGIVHTIGWVNFLQDPTQSPHMTSAQVAEGFGVSQGTMLAKSKTIRDELDLIQMDPDWCLPALLEHNPLVWMLKVNGFIMDIRMAPREAQEEAYRQGLIPFIPADQQEHKAETGTGGKIIKFPIQQQDSLKPKSSHEQQKDCPQLFEGLDEGEY